MSNWFTDPELYLDPRLGEIGLQTDALKAIITGLGEAMLWVALALVAVLVIVGIIINFKFHDKLVAFLKIAISIMVGFAVSLIGVMLILQIGRLSLKNEINANFWLWVGFACTCIAALSVCALVKVFKGKYFKITAIVSSLVLIAYVIVLFCLYPTESDYAPINGNNALYIILSVILVVAIFSLAFLFDRKKTNDNNTKSLTYAGICIAISYALSYIKFGEGPQGGSITLASMLPLMLYSYIFGARKGVLAGLVYGVLQCIQDPQIYEPLQVMLDYPIAFSALGLAGLFKNCKLFKGKKILEFLAGIIIAGCMRYLAHVLSGYFVFYSYAAWSDSAALQASPLLYSIVYNTLILIDTVIDVVVGILLFSSKTMVHQIELINPERIENVSK